MGLWNTIKNLVAPNEAGPPEVRKLNGSSESASSASLKSLPPGERGWITFAEARSLFSPMDDQYAFGEMDHEGKTNLASFAAREELRSTFEFMPIEQRVYFVRTEK